MQWAKIGEKGAIQGSRTVFASMASQIQCFLKKILNKFAAAQKGLATM